ncbi:PREDICTED: protein WVD2-like 7 isoform X3 [Nelumbo nucifera]|uniref:Protein WVD2-like 7 isoform X3 n=1 Tax=Nelumbo nucifera TaxID=4432 RepID=A0A1U8PZ78_NELNU|nr:PREDICTED: protein WVD2-like 7 isoform X3 [Nelumbo nucifera]
MATDMDQTYCDWSRSELPADRSDSDSQEASISEMLDHGSISFGRYSVESLAWEKWSVFSHNKCQEELEKFKAPGLVARKKAHFEEYYRRIRTLKKLQVEQETNLAADPFSNGAFLEQKDEQGPKWQQNSVDSTTEEEGMNPRNDPVAHFLEGESALTCENDGHNVISERNLEASVSIVEPSASAQEVAPEHSESTSRWSLEDACSDNIISNNVELNFKKGEVHKAAAKAKETAASARRKTKLDSSTKANANKPFDRLRSLLHKAVSVEAEKKLVSSKVATARVNINNTSMSSQKPLARVDNTRVTSSNDSAPVPSHRSLGMDKGGHSSPSNVKDGTRGGNLISKSLEEKLPSKSSVHAQRSSCAQIAVTGSGVQNMTLENREPKAARVKSSGIGNKSVIPKGRNTNNQRPKTITENRTSGICIPRFTNNSAQTKTVQNNVVKPSARSSVREEKEKMGREEMDRIGFSSRFSSLVLNGVSHAQAPKLEHKKVVPSQSASLTLGGKNARQRKPIWR